MGNGLLIRTAQIKTRQWSSFLLSFPLLFSPFPTFFCLSSCLSCSCHPPPSPPTSPPLALLAPAFFHICKRTKRMFLHLFEGFFSFCFVLVCCGAWNITCSLLLIRCAFTGVTSEVAMQVASASTSIYSVFHIAYFCTKHFASWVQKRAEWVHAKKYSNKIAPSTKTRSQDSQLSITSENDWVTLAC